MARLGLPNQSCPHVRQSFFKKSEQSFFLQKTIDPSRNGQTYLCRLRLRLTDGLGSLREVAPGEPIDLPSARLGMTPTCDLGGFLAALAERLGPA
jgi:hypothetical protein